MKAIISILIIFLVLTGCGPINVETRDIKTEPLEYKLDGHHIVEITIDGYQYLASYSTESIIYFTHKGNCNNHKDTIK
jgi:hypothetical protein